LEEGLIHSGIFSLGSMRGILSCILESSGLGSREDSFLGLGGQPFQGYGQEDRKEDE
jgi:hypothetical protein